MIYLDDLLTATGGQRAGPPHPTQFPAFCYNSRRASPGELFVAVRTEMEQVVEGLLADPADAARLVRWLARLEVQVARPARLTWVEVDLEAVAYNIRQVKHIVGPEVEIRQP